MERPILFNTEMTRAILNDIKRETRRPVKGVPTLDSLRLYRMYNDKPEIDGIIAPNGRVYDTKPLCNPGDTLYVRETWAVNRITPQDPDYLYKADYDCTIIPYSNWKWKPSIHMPKEAARLFLTVADVVLEQLRDVTEEGARLEGFASRDEFIREFLLIYPDCSLDSWVWVIKFEKK